ncbi:ThiF family adenylyltransferase [Streptomyces sp. NBC_00631]|uniref:HesA/MoeB/ThiF family protein n=1 Tax=Streptomyces sp. NBC_00631 TaxID=2975793 RepID=UPI0030E4A223
MNGLSSLPRHLVLGAAAYGSLAAAASTARLRLGMRIIDQGDVGYVDGAVGTDVLVLPEPPAPDWVLDEPGPAVVCWAEQDGVRAHRSTRLAEGLGERLGTSVIPSGSVTSERIGAIIGADALQDTCVAVLGLGSGGSFIVRELARAGVGRFVLLDDDRLEVGNVSRHECGLNDVGRLKVNAMRDVVHRHHPGARVVTSTTRISGDTRSEVRSLLRGERVDLVICATDARESRLLVNRLCLQGEYPMIIGGVYRRAYGGIVQRVIPGLTPCYQCFVQALPREAADNEISSLRDASRSSYTDREVTPQPGLSSDIVPIALLMVKLALLELLDGRSDAFRTLSADLVAPIYQWINRRELAHTSWQPMGVNVDSQSVLRWYGLLLERNRECAHCGSGTSA